MVLVRLLRFNVPSRHLWQTMQRNRANPSPLRWGAIWATTFYHAAQVLAFGGVSCAPPQILTLKWLYSL